MLATRAPLFSDESLGGQVKACGFEVGPLVGDCFGVGVGVGVGVVMGGVLEPPPPPPQAARASAVTRMAAKLRVIVPLLYGRLLKTT
jgi:hypothetical protein